MTDYIITHLVLTVIFLPLLFLISKIKAVSNRFQLLVLYMALLKSFLPWGLFRLYRDILPDNMVVQGYSYDLPFGKTGSNVEYLNTSPAGDRLILLMWLILFIIMLTLFLKKLLYINGVVKAGFVYEDTADGELIAGLILKTGIRKDVVIKTSGKISSPFIWQNKEPVILLPASFRLLNYDEKKIIIAHELAHIKRKDFIKYLILESAVMLFYFSPFVRIVKNEILNREEIETDLYALRITGITPAGFGETIINFISISRSEGYPAPALFKSNRRRMKMRLEKLFQKPLSSGTKLVQKIIFAGVLVLVMINFAPEVKGKEIPSSGTMVNPLSSGRITMRFGITRHPITGKVYDHQGIDLAAPYGTLIISPAAGKITSVGYNNQAGHMLAVEHADGIKTIYTHLKNIYVKEGETVRQGDKIASVGTSGISTGPHLHFEIHVNGKPVDPFTCIRN